MFFRRWLFEESRSVKAPNVLSFMQCCQNVRYSCFMTACLQYSWIYFDRGFFKERVNIKHMQIKLLRAW